nr:DUF736 family protein [uncultured Hyphomonas sp.]
MPSRTMMINVKAQMVPVIDKAAAGPDYRIFAGDAELGAAWREESKDGETRDPAGSCRRSKLRLPRACIRY